MAYSRHPELKCSQVEATLILMRKRAIQSNLPFVAPTDEIDDLQFTSGETKDKVISDVPPKSPLRDTFHQDPDEELSNKVMFGDEGASIATPPLFSSFLFPSKPSSSRPDLDFGISSSSFEPVDEEIKINDQAQMNLGAKTESTPKPDNTTTSNKLGPSEPLVNQGADQTKSHNSTSDTRSSAGNYVDPFSLLEL